ncbi:hypothetical protein POTOM_014896 [Populus tomentosa]|uniref:Uncharacterized protein n=1 Tax=Populus tomentosa TaxID=118781 RepID=A0A8X7ZYY1_POPTO|nr:hypothetical protein POTOM_014896 [Populus tomentosa]
MAPPGPGCCIIVRVAVELVAVTVSHPPGQAYDEKASSTPTKHAEPPREEIFGDFSLPEAGKLFVDMVGFTRAFQESLLIGARHSSILLFL